MRRRRRLLLACAALLALLLAAVPLTGCAFNGPAYRGPVSAHFDGERFFNPGRDTPDKSLLDVLAWKLTSEAEPWEERAVLTAVPPARVSGGTIRATWVGHSTVLLQFDGLNLLTDPHWSPRASPVSFAGPRRFVAPGVRWEDLPPIDVVLLSHNHYDHCDLPTLARLAARDKPRILTMLGVDLLLAEAGIPGAEAMDWWDERTLAPGVTTTAVPAVHFSARGTGDRNRTLWGGFVVSAPSGRIWFAGDTGDGDFPEAIAARFAPIDLALIPIGAYLPRDFMRPVHIDPAEAVAVMRRAGVRTALGVHWATFPLGDDGQDRPAIDLDTALAAAGVPRPDFRVLPIGGWLEITR